MIDPEIGFTSDVIRDQSRFVGRTDLIRDCIKSLNTPSGLIAVYGKRGVGKSSLLRQIQQMALGDYTLAKTAGRNQSVYRLTVVPLGSCMSDLRRCWVNPRKGSGARNYVVARSTELDSGEALYGQAEGISDQRRRHAQNTFDDPHRVRPVTTQVRLGGSTFHYRFPPATIGTPIFRCHRSPFVERMGGSAPSKSISVSIVCLSLKNLE